ncbi:alkene reductase [Novosphingobium profundi]|uniref:alkene reductase n=1 Tax=Novosphingobium profundi TaxID=1774954 RepID=UPI001BDB5A1B|nr:alkene reductase [Novosphingobium profundi]MBT0670214.1 alkene reductase [Novosphingobium profundi]
MTSLFDPIQIGDLTLANRIWMPPMTRARATQDGVPTRIMIEYYRQRATAGLIISEGVYVNGDSSAFDRAPGLYTQEQVEAWKSVTAAVHAAGGHIFAQLWHCGRASNAALTGGVAPLSPSGRNEDLDKLAVQGLLANGEYVKIAASPSKAMNSEDIARTIADYGNAAANAKAAGFDGVEIHAANGYLPHQFLSPEVNARKDAYGGSRENRARFLMDVFAAAAAHFTPTRVGVRVSPLATYNNALDPDPESTYADLAQRLDAVGAGYLHAADQNAMAGGPSFLPRVLEMVRPHFRGVLVANGSLTPETGASLVDEGMADAVTYGRPFIANPDLVGRIRAGAKLAEPRSVGWYAMGEDGYTDYPALQEA